MQHLQKATKHRLWWPSDALLCVLVQLSIMLLWLEASGSIPEAVSTGLGLFVLFFPFVYMWRLYNDHPKTMVRSIVRFRC
jgi:uncharacterized protein (DUF2062 family)